jgi:hypothetical protein
VQDWNQQVFPMLFGMPKGRGSAIGTVWHFLPAFLPVGGRHASLICARGLSSQVAGEDDAINRANCAPGSVLGAMKSDMKRIRTIVGAATHGNGAFGRRTVGRLGESWKTEGSFARPEAHKPEQNGKCKRFRPALEMARTTDDPPTLKGFTDSHNPLCFGAQTIRIH